MNILNIQLLLEVYAHTMLSVKALMIMGKVKSTSDFQDTSASLDGTSNTVWAKDQVPHAETLCRYQHKASQLLCNKNLAYSGGTSNLILHLERKSIQYQGHRHEDVKQTAK